MKEEDYLPQFEKMSSLDMEEKLIEDKIFRSITKMYIKTVFIDRRFNVEEMAKAARQIAQGVMKDIKKLK